MNSEKKLSLSFPIHETEIKLETGVLARQADGSVIARMGETAVLATVVVGKVKNADYFPLQVIYEERLYAAGKIKGSRFIKREGRPTEDAVLTGRMIDRSLRSLFSSYIRNEIQVVVTVLSVDEVHPPDTLSVIAASSACALAVKNFQGPVSSVRVGLERPDTSVLFPDELKKQIESAQSYNDIVGMLEPLAQYLDENNEKDGEILKDIYKTLGLKNPEWAAKMRLKYKTSQRVPAPQLFEKLSQEPVFSIAPSYESIHTSLLDLVVSSKGRNIVMIEAGGQIIPEALMDTALDKALAILVEFSDFQTEFISQARSKGLGSLKELEYSELPEEFADYWVGYEHDIEEALKAMDDRDGKTARSEALKVLLSTHTERLALVSGSEEEAESAPDALKTLYEVNKSWDFSSQLKLSFDQSIKKVVRHMALEGKRVDGRPLDKTRDIQADIDILPRTHSSSLFSRGQTQVLNVLTLGTFRDAQTLDNMEDFEEGTKRYMHHYNFPSFSVGETGRYGAPSRREIGHGALAEKALLPVLPTEDEFPYTIRLVSECLESNGSTSMASTCSSSLSLMAGGVPIKDMVAGVAMGLIYDEQTEQYRLLTDIQGFEDHFGDMDFKVTGTRDGITAIQLDNKVAGMSIDIIKDALKNSRTARLHILDIMEQTISQPRKDISAFAPGVLQTTVPVDKIGEVIGPSGKTIKSIIQEFEVEIDIEDDGRVFIYGKNTSQSKAALKKIETMTKEYQVGERIPAKVYRVEKYGAFVHLEGGSKEGMIHISQLSDKRVEKVEDVVNLGDEVMVEISQISEKGINLKLIAKPTVHI